MFRNVVVFNALCELLCWKSGLSRNTSDALHSKEQLNIHTEFALPQDLKKV